MSAPSLLPPSPLRSRTGNASPSGDSFVNPNPQNAPGAAAAVGHVLENSIPLSIFPIKTDKFVFAFCGLPGRGKTHISRRLGNYLSFFNAIPVQVFATADYRKRMCGAMKEAEFFDPNNKEAVAKRDECNRAAIKDMVHFLETHDSAVAIMDSSSPTHERRAYLKNAAQAIGAKVMFIEVNNDSEEFLAKHYRTTVEYSDDYTGLDADSKVQDYCKKVDLYKSFYEPLDGESTHKVEGHWTYMKCDHAKQDFVIHRVKGYLQQKAANFIMNLRTTSHAFYLSRHGQSEYNELGRIGGDSGLTEHGLAYARELSKFAQTHIMKDAEGRDVPARLWTSTMRRTKETAQFIPQEKLLLRSETDPSLEYEWVQMRPRAWHHLDELFAGSCDGMTYEEIEQNFPEEWERRSVDKVAYRYPRGESYLDVIARLEPIIVEMERQREPLLIIAHQAILRIIYAFYQGKTRAEAPYLSIPLNTVIEINPGPIICEEKRHVLYKPPKKTLVDGQDEPNKPDDPPSH